MNCKYLWLLLGLIPSVSPLGQAQDKEVDYQVHEWGVFTAPRNAEWLMQDMLREWQGFPDFFQGVMPERQLLYRGPVTKPVLFFHGSYAEQVELFIHFSTGMPMIWWPPVEFPASGSWGITLPEELRDKEPASTIKYVLLLNQDNGERNAVADHHWVQKLRAVESAPFSVHGSSSARIHPGENKISESFVYYDGLMKPPRPPVVTRTNSGLKLSVNSDHDWLDVMIINRAFDSGDLTVGFVEKIAEGASEHVVELQPVNPQGFSKFQLDFQKSLEGAGLNPDEAKSLIDVWQAGLFERAGTTLWYRIPQETYDDWIPLYFAPQPSDIVRVGLVVHHHLEPELETNVTELVDRLGSDSYEIRRDADTQLREIGGAAAPALEKLVDDTNIERRSRAQLILQSLDVKELLEQTMKRRLESAPYRRR